MTSGLPAYWPDVAAVVLANREREVSGERTALSQYYISNHIGPAAGFARWGPGHWHIKNGLYWVLDVVFREDRSRVREGNAGVNLAMVRRLAVLLLRRALGKGSVVTKRLEAGRDENYL